eukprot:TRINITY_DN2591_c0_g1_i1.p1 TRINITY_DN2591_c0_g1~~TRINITY_DN2591_c0_g1_i1.p1  ORF type:complete len:296 (-),score=102.87 TRINITY_DN2591_c0_g1_i1:16-867(-)
MSRVFILGATGFIGSGVATAFVREGYRVYGLARSEEKANQLRKIEVIPVIGTLQNPASWEETAKSSDIIIDASVDYQDSTYIQYISKVLIPLASQKVVIFTSGIWVHGTAAQYEDENTPLNKPFPLVKWRVAIQQEFIKAGAIIVEPGLLYGYTGSLTAGYLKSLKDGGSFYGNEDQEPYVPTVHLDDLADVYVKIAQKGKVLRGETFLAFSQVERMKDVYAEFGRLTGFKGEIKWIKPDNPFAEAMAGHQPSLSSSKAKTTLNWTPKKLSLLQGADVYVKAL